MQPARQASAMGQGLLSAGAGRWKGAEGGGGEAPGGEGGGEGAGLVVGGAGTFEAGGGGGGMMPAAASMVREVFAALSSAITASKVASGVLRRRFQMPVWENSLELE